MSDPSPEIRPAPRPPCRQPPHRYARDEPDPERDCDLCKRRGHIRCPRRGEPPWAILPIHQVTLRLTMPFLGSSLQGTAKPRCGTENPWAKRASPALRATPIYCGGLDFGADFAAFAMKSFNSDCNSGLTAAMRCWTNTVDCFSKTGILSTITSPVGER